MSNRIVSVFRSTLVSRVKVTENRRCRDLYTLVYSTKLYNIKFKYDFLRDTYEISQKITNAIYVDESNTLRKLYYYTDNNRIVGKCSLYRVL